MIVHRVGTFFMLVGLVLIGLFILSDVAGAPTCNFLVIGAVLLVVGAYLWFRNPLPAAPPSERFRIFKGSGKKQGQK